MPGFLRHFHRKLLCTRLNLGSSFACLWGFISLGSLESNFDISHNFKLSYFPFSFAFDISVDEAITTDDLARLSLLLTDPTFRAFALFAFSSAWTTLQLEYNFSPLSPLPFFTEGFFWPPLALPFCAPSYNVAFNCCLTFCLSSNFILIFLLYWNTL